MTNSRDYIEKHVKAIRLAGIPSIKPSDCDHDFSLGLFCSRCCDCPECKEIRITDTIEAMKLDRRDAITTDARRFTHRVNGKQYTSDATSLDDYKAQIRKAYGSLRGVTNIQADLTDPRNTDRRDAITTDATTYSFPARTIEF